MTSIARVFVNRIEVGAVPLAQYQALEKRAHRDWRLYVAQGFNLLRVFLKFAFAAIVSLPALWLVAVVAWAWLGPDSVLLALSELRTITPESLREGVSELLARSVALTLVFHLLHAAVFGFHRYGFKDIFEDEVNQRVREVLEVPAEGNLFCLVDEADGIRTCRG